MKKDQETGGASLLDQPGGDGGSIRRRKPDRFRGETKIGRIDREEEPDRMEDPRGTDQSPQQAGRQESQKASRDLRQDQAFPRRPPSQRE